jgi:hypothetical protein
MPNMASFIELIDGTPQSIAACRSSRKTNAQLGLGLERQVDCSDFSPQPDHQLFARSLGVLARFGSYRFHQGVKLLVRGFVNNVVQVEGL